MTKNYAFAWSFTFGIILLLIGSSQAIAQINYKHPQINAKGEFLDAKGNITGWISKQGIIMDAKGMKVAQVDGEGNLVGADGKKMGRAAKNGNLSDIDGVVLLSVGEPNGDQCEVKDKSGRVIAMVHKNYKAQAGCMVHCLSGMKM